MPPRLPEVLNGVVHYGMFGQTGRTEQDVGVNEPSAGIVIHGGSIMIGVDLFAREGRVRKIQDLAGELAEGGKTLGQLLFRQPGGRGQDRLGGGSFFEDLFDVGLNVNAAAGGLGGQFVGDLHGDGHDGCLSSNLA